jgi:predicted component of type VI protein secretion system
MTPKVASQLMQIATAANVDLYAMARLASAHGAQVRFAHDAALSLAASDVAALHVQPSDGQRASATLLSTCLGLTGATSPLPQEALQALEEITSEDEGQELRIWLEFLHHRVLQLLHVGVQKSQPSTGATVALTDAFAQQLLEPSAYARQKLPPQLRLALAAVLDKPSCEGRDVCWALGVVLGGWGLGAPCAWQPLTGDMVPLPADAGCALGQRNHALAQNFVLGDSAFCPCSRVRITLGPVNHGWLRRCAPHSDAVAHQLHAVLQVALPHVVAADVDVALDGATLPPWRLVAAGGPMKPCPLDGLGVVTFLGPLARTTSVPWPLPQELG